MKRIFPVVGLLATIAVASTATAQRTTAVGLSGGLTIPSGDVGDAAASGYNFGGHFYYRPQKSMLGFRFDLATDRMNAKDKAVDATFNAISFVANGTVMAGSSTSTYRPYGIGGLGIYKTKFEQGIAGGNGALQENSNVGIQLGGGVDIPLNGFSTFIEAKYVKVFSSGSFKWAYIPITAGIHF